MGKQGFRLGGKTNFHHAHVKLDQGHDVCLEFHWLGIGSSTGWESLQTLESSRCEGARCDIQMGLSKNYVGREENWQLNYCFQLLW